MTMNIPNGIGNRRLLAELLPSMAAGLELASAANWLVIRDERRK
jgi:hypothetical protein